MTTERPEMISRRLPPRRLHMASVAEQTRVEDSTELVASAILTALPAVVLVASSGELLSIQVVSKTFALSSHIVYVVGPDLPAGLREIEAAAGAFVGGFD